MVAHNKTNEPIFALATAQTRSALHLHRISGHGVLDLLEPVVLCVRSRRPILKSMKPNECRYALVVDLQKQIIDDAMISVFYGPKSFTGEDVIEISVHGNALISARLQSLLRSLGMRDAKPGEFSFRAVLHGKQDLTQAEGINELIHAQTYGALALARNNASGVLSKETQSLRHEILSLSAYLEAHIDFAPDEVGVYEPKSLLKNVYEIEKRLQALLSSYDTGLKIKEGVKIVLCGKPNAGKSSLYNALLKSDRAIVTDIPGTTRDVLEDQLTIQNKDFVILDTAGIRDTDDVVEKLGVQRSFQSIEKADVICLLMDVSNHKPDEMEAFIQSEICSVPCHKDQILIPIVTKKDQLDQSLIEQIQALKKQSDKLNSMVIISTTDTNELKEVLLKTHADLTDQWDINACPTLISTRQKDKVRLALSCVIECQHLIESTDYPEKIAMVLNNARVYLDEIVGEISLEQVLDHVFSSFCIGK